MIKPFPIGSLVVITTTPKRPRGTFPWTTVRSQYAGEVAKVLHYHVRGYWFWTTYWYHLEIEGEPLIYTRGYGRYDESLEFGDDYIHFAHKWLTAYKDPSVVENKSILVPGMGRRLDLTR